MKIIVMAGGSGERLWPLSRENYPKQFLSLVDQKSLLEMTLLRFLGRYSVDDIYVITNQTIYSVIKHHLFNIHPQLREQIIVEPEKKNTGPALALALQFFDQSYTELDEVFLFCPSDSYISPVGNFLHALEEGCKLAKKEKIVLFGVTPYKAETSYGYIKVGEYQNVEQFIEKPSAEYAEQLIKDNSYLWNCGMFLGTKKTFLNELKQHCPEIFDQLGQSYVKTLENFHNMPNLSVDYGLIEKSSSAAVVQLDIGWGDLGSWNGLYDLSEKDRDGNAISGQVTCINSQNNLIYSQSRETIVSSIHQLTIIDTEDVLLIGDRNSLDMKKMVERFKETNKKKILQSHRTYAPWGFFETISECAGYKIKKLSISPYEKLSLQYHHHRSEHWVVIHGEALITKGDNQYPLKMGESVYIDQKEVHRIENPNEDYLEIIEIQMGRILEESDIVRIQDEYGRTSKGKLAL